MPKDASTFELAISERPALVPLTQWFYTEIRRAILDGRLQAGERLPASRDFARQYSVSRGTVVNVFERLQSEGYLQSRVGDGTRINARIPEAPRSRQKVAAPGNIRNAEPFSGAPHPQPARPFRLHEPALNEFPIKTWARIAGRRLRLATPALLAGGGIRGYEPLREAIAGYLGASRGVSCDPGQIFIVTGVQQALDLLARFLFRPGDTVHMEDPGYFGAAMAFRQPYIKLSPVPLDAHGMRVPPSGPARAAYLTPGHQFPMGMTMPLHRRVEIVEWSRKANAYLIEDDYDSEYRFEGLPLPALHGLDREGRVIFTGTFNKLLFPALRIGYLVLPPSLVDGFHDFRFRTDLQVGGIDQVILADFISEGHLSRHIRRMRDLYGARLQALLDGGQRLLKGLFEISTVRAGLYTAAFLRNGMGSREAEIAARQLGLETLGLHRFAARSQDPCGLLLGFAAFDEAAIHRGLTLLARIGEQPIKTGVSLPLAGRDSIRD